MRYPRLDGGPEKIVLAGDELIGLIADLKHRSGYRLNDSQAIRLAQEIMIARAENNVAPTK